MSFEEAVKKRLGFTGDYHVSVEASGGQQVQIGDYTWDSEPYEFDLCVTPVKRHTKRIPRNDSLLSSFGAWERGEKTAQTVYDEYATDVPDPGRPSFTKTFGSVPEIWDWLEEES